MMMAVRAVYVPVGDLVLRRGPDVEHLAVEAQPLSGQFVIAVEDRLAVRDVGYAPDDFIAILLGDQMTSNSDVRWQLIERFNAHQVRIVVAERVFGLECDGNGIANLLVLQRLFDLRKDSGVTSVQIRYRFIGFLDQSIAGIEEPERKRDHGVGEDIHDRVES